jgi:hypothetical protein
MTIASGASKNFADTGVDTAAQKSPTVTKQPRIYSPSGTFIIALAGYMLFFAGHYVSGDTAQRIAWAKALLEGSNDISSYYAGLHFTKYGIGGSLLHMPFLLIAAGIKRLTGIRCEGPVNMMLYEINGALGITLIFSILRDRCKLTSRDAFIRAVVIGFATVWFAYTKVEYAESLAAVSLLAALRFADSRPVTAGFAGGLSIAIRPDYLLWLVPSAICGSRNRVSLVKVFAGTIPWLLVILWSNYARTGNIWSSGYEVNFSTPLLLGVYGLLFSAGKSALIFSPLLLLYCSAVRRLWPEQSMRWLVTWSLVVVVGQLCFYGKWWDWSGDDSWGPRLIIFGTLAALLTIAASDLSYTRGFAVLAVLGFLVQLPPLLIGPHTVILMDHRLSVESGDWSSTTMPLSLDQVRFDPAYSQFVNTTNLLLLKALPSSKTLRSTRWMTSAPVVSMEIPIDLLWVRLFQIASSDHGSVRYGYVEPRALMSTMAGARER